MERCSLGAAWRNAWRWSSEDDQKEVGVVDEAADVYAWLASELASIRRDLVGADQKAIRAVAAAPEALRPSLRNLIHYLAFRKRDIRPLQEALALQGLSSLGRAEAHVLWSVDTLL